MECPEISELAAFAETHAGPDALMRHLAGCDACQEALQSLQEEVLSLQIPLSELWFRHHVSCPRAEVLADYAGGRLDAETLDYVKFHIEDLECTHCQGRLGEAEAAASRDVAKKVSRSRKRVGDATSVLLRDLNRRA